jgi:hypothetical protein
LFHIISASANDDKDNSRRSPSSWANNTSLPTSRDLRIALKLT